MPRDGCAVLVVDDDRINRALLSNLLEQEGYRPRTAVNGREALVALGQEPFDAVLLDIVMPEVDGLEVLRTLKADARLWHIPVIVISGLEDTESIVSCLELGADDYVQKPFDPVLLRARLNACLARRQFHVLEVEYQKMVQEQAAELQDLRREADGASGENGASVPGGQPQVSRGPVAVVAVGLGGLHSLAGEADPVAALAVAEAFEGVVEALAARFDGAVSARSADSFTVVLGGAKPCADPAATGLEMAVALDEEMTDLVAGWEDRPHPKPSWGAGLAVGDATVGVGDGGSGRVTVIGPVVDRAARLRHLGLPGAVLLDETARAATRRAGTIAELESEPDEAGADATTPAYRLRRRPRIEGRSSPGRGPITRS